jgi:hypothetical protein
LPHDSKRRRAMAALTKGRESHDSFGRCDDDDDETITYI